METLHPDTMHEYKCTRLCTSSDHKNPFPISRGMLHNSATNAIQTQNFFDMKRWATFSRVQEKKECKHFKHIVLVRNSQGTPIFDISSMSKQLSDIYKLVNVLKLQTACILWAILPSFLQWLQNMFLWNMFPDRVNVILKMPFLHTHISPPPQAPRWPQCYRRHRGWFSYSISVVESRVSSRSPWA